MRRPPKIITFLRCHSEPQAKNLANKRNPSLCSGSQANQRKCLNFPRHDPTTSVKSNPNVHSESAAVISKSLDPERYRCSLSAACRCPQTTGPDPPGFLGAVFRWDPDKGESPFGRLWPAPLYIFPVWLRSPDPLSRFCGTDPLP